MRDLEPDYRKEYEEYTKRLELFAQILAIVFIVGVISVFLSVVIRSI